MVKWLKHCTSTTGSTGLTLAQRTKILACCIAWPKNSGAGGEKERKEKWKIHLCRLPYKNYKHCKVQKYLVYLFTWKIWQASISSILTPKGGVEMNPVHSIVNGRIFFPIVHVRIIYGFWLPSGYVCLFHPGVSEERCHSLDLPERTTCQHATTF